MFGVRCSAFALSLLTFAASTSHSQPARPPLPPGNTYDPYQPLVRQGHLPDQVLNVLDGIQILPEEIAATMPGAVRLKAGLVRSPLLPLTPSGAAPVHLSTPSPVSQRSALMLTRLRGGDGSAEVREWLRELPKEGLVVLIEREPRRHNDHAASDLLIRAFLEMHGPSSRAVGQLGRTAQLRLADYYRSQSDSRCVGIYEALLRSRGETPGPGVPELFGHAFFLKERGDLQAAHDLFMKVRQYTADEYLVADGLVEAGRCLWWAGRTDEAAALLRQVLDRGQTDWVDFAARAQLARIEADRGAWDGARQLLAPVFEGKHGARARLEGLCDFAALMCMEGRLQEASELYSVASTADLPRGAVDGRLGAVAQRAARMADRCSGVAVDPLRRVGGGGPLRLARPRGKPTACMVTVETARGASIVVTDASPPLECWVPPQIPSEGTAGCNRWRVAVRMTTADALPDAWTGRVQIGLRNAPHAASLNIVVELRE